jgi:CubicO group peptidase (beta-lactamase class C family)
MKSLLTFLIFFSSLSLLAQPDLKKLDAYFAKAQKDWGVPGMSIAIVKDGKLVFAKGYGVKEIGGSNVPDENTLYAIASNSKAFTSFLLGQLVDKKKIAWNDKVQKYLPYFQLADGWTSQATTIQDLLCHRVGLGTFSGDLLWYRSTLSPEDVIRRVKYLKPAYSFRAGFGYSNLMFITAGELTEQVTGQKWGDLVKQNVFTPLGMTRTITTTKDLNRIGNMATPHALMNGTHQPIQWEDWGDLAAAGGIISSVKDMSQWMLLHLNQGMWNQDTLLSRSSWNLQFTPHNSFSVDQTNNQRTGNFSGYGLGWAITDYHGRLRAGHTGGYSGMLSAVAMLPQEKLGVVILTNGMVPVYNALINYTFDAFLQKQTRDWSKENLERFKKSVAEDTRIADRIKARMANTKPSFTLASYTGEYFTDTYGRIFVKEESGKLKLTFEHSPGLSASLEHWHLDTFQIKWDSQDMLAWFSFGTIQFETDNNARVTGISFDVPNDDFFFEELNAQKVK